MKPSALVERLELSIGIAGAPRSVKEVLEEELFHHFEYSRIAATELASKLEAAVIRIIDSRFCEASEQGVTALLAITGTMNNIVCGSCYILSSDTSQISKLKQQRAHHTALLGHIKQLSFGEFELFGKRILSEIGASEAHVTKQSNDQGIDFFGRLSLGELQSLPAPYFRLSHDLKLLFAGQAKHYPSSAIGTNVVRELIGAVALARTKTFSKDGLDIFRDLDIRPFSPVVAILFTTGRFSSGAVYLAAAAGIVLKDGPQLAAFLADKGIGINDNGATTGFDPLVFSSWLLS